MCVAEVTLIRPDGKVDDVVLSVRPCGVERRSELIRIAVLKARFS